MTNDEKIAHEYAIENWEHYEEGQSDYDALKQAVLYGLKAGRPKWHKVADGDLPKEEGSYLLYLYDEDTKSTFYEIFGVARRCVDRDDVYLESMIWTINDVIAWCEIPQYTE